MSRKYNKDYSKFILHSLNWLWKPLWTLWTVIIGGSAINIGSSWFTTGMLMAPGSPLAWLINYFSITLPALLILILLTVVSGFAHQHTASITHSTDIDVHFGISTSDERIARKNLLQSVQKIWIEGFLEQSLYYANWIDLHLQEKNNVLENPWQFIVQESWMKENLVCLLMKVIL